MCEHEGQPCPGKSCHCDCMTCMFGEVIKPRESTTAWLDRMERLDPAYRQAYQ